MVIAIDGPSGAGKGTVARAVAATFGYRHVDTGRDVPRRGLDGGPARPPSTTSRRRRTGRVGVILDAPAPCHRWPRRHQRDPDAGNRRPPPSGGPASAGARGPGRAAARHGRRRRAGDGRPRHRHRRVPRRRREDLPGRLRAERARRRAQRSHHGGSNDVATVASQIAARDRSDRTRAASPLTIADDSIIVDTTGMDIDAVVARVMGIVRERVGANS